MKSNVCEIKKGGAGLESILSEVEKVTSYNELPHKEALRLRLLAEELTGMLPELVKNFEGIFWLQNDGAKYELHVEISAEEMTKEKKASLVEVSASKKNAASKSFMGKIREIAENMILMTEDFNLSATSSEYMYDYNMDLHYTYAWTLYHYTSSKKDSDDNREEWDELEKSIVAKLADDVIVGVRGKKVDIIIKKEF